MRYRALATDFDGTLAWDGRVAASTINALQRVHDLGRRLILVTGRELTDLFATSQDTHLFDWIVAENGAVLHEPRTRATTVLAPPPPLQLIERLRAQAVPLSLGHSIVATVSPHEHAVLDAIHELGLEWHVIFNKGSVMALPADVTKATGLLPVLSRLGVSPLETIGIGDAENDQAFLRLCGLAVAVNNALPAVKAGAHLTTHGARGEGVEEVIDRWLNGGLDDLEPDLCDEGGR
ncbi:MAG: HAD family hydrolase [Vicinamibacterales bacterium]